jgi:hypothetical protein
MMGLGTQKLVRTLAALGVAALGVAAVAALGVDVRFAQAADLYNDDVPPPRAGAAYDDPRYADLYGEKPAPRHRVETYRGYEPDLPVPRERVYRDDRYEQERRYTDRVAPGRQARASCPSKDEISRMLESDGWSRFANPQVLDKETATVEAQRPNGRPYRLEVDRCSGEILAVRPLHDQRYGEQDRYGSYNSDPRRNLRSY